MRASRALFLICAFAAACTSTAPELQPGKPPPEGSAVIVVGLPFGTGPLERKLVLNGPNKRTLNLKTESDLWIGVVPAGPYTIRRISDRATINDTLSFHAEPGRVRYVGTLYPVRDAVGNLAVAVHDEWQLVQRDLRLHYPDLTAPAEAGLMRSSLPPVEGAEDLIVALSPPIVESRGAWSIGFGYGSGGTRVGVGYGGYR